VTDLLQIRRALLSVSDKDGLVPLAEGLAAGGVRLVATDSTGAALRSAGLEVTLVSELTGFPEVLGGRVKTLHPIVHAGILADKSNTRHLDELAEHGIEPFDLVVVNLYPFERTVASGAERDEVIEQIDIGGPTIIRAAAKNVGSVVTVVDPRRYDEFLESIRDNGGVPRDLRTRLAAEAFEHVALYDAAIAAWFHPLPQHEGPPASLTIGLERVADLRYGENPHQQAALYRDVLSSGPLGGSEILQGKQMSFNNWLDAEAARGLSGALAEPAAVIVKHNNPSGAAVAATPAAAYRAAYESDTLSAFGGVVAFNAEVDEEAAAAMADVFTEVVVAPGYTEAALHAFGNREKLRVLRAPSPKGSGLDVRAVEGGAVVQDRDFVVESRIDMKVVSSREPSEDEWDDLLFAWTVAAWVKSNAIVLATARATVGVGAGQMSRVDAVDIACRKAGERARGAVAASDAFFPFRDGVDRAAESGVTAIIQPGGSVRDNEVVESADEHGMALVLTGRRHFRH
jgi:phosphoribosylaminoimidazolecarboxamide formyltransferase / IMP cyclohydrolase